MTDREKIISDVIWAFSEWENNMYCPGEDWSDVHQSRDMVIALLKAQEPRLVTESDFDGADEYGYLPVWTEEKDGDMYCECIPKVAITDPDGIEVLRYWTSRPTDAQREATPWN